MTPTVATSLRPKGIMTVWKECISHDWNTINYFRVIGAGMKLDQMVLGRENNGCEPPHDLASTYYSERIAYRQN